MFARTIIFFIIAARLSFWPINLLGNDNKDEAEKLFQQALVSLQKKDTTQAVIYLKGATRKNYKLAKAHNQLALIYMNAGTVYGRFKATFEIEKAIRCDSKNLQYRFNQALLNLKKGMTSLAEHQFKKILEKDPDNYQCYLHLASIKENELLHYQNMVSIDPGSDGVIFFQEFADKLLDQTAEYYRKAISLRPQETEPYYRLSLIFYEFDRLKEMIQLLESAVKINPRDKNCHLFLGFGYHGLREYELANSEYEKAKKLMSPEEWAVMESIEPILSDSKKVEFLAMGPRKKHDFVNNFWRKNEPFYLSKINERKLEHYSRVAYANLRFSDPRKNIEGWQTDMGKVYIRYGKPKYRFRTRPYLGAHSPGTRNPLVHSREIWIYPDFRFKFEDEYLSGAYTFARDYSPEFDYKLIYENMTKEKPQYYQMFPDSMTFTPPLDIVRFFDVRKMPDPEFCFGIPLDSIRYQGVLPIGKNLKSGLFIFDENWKKVLEKKQNFRLVKENFVDIGKQLFFTSHTGAPLKPGNYHYALEFEDDFSGKRAKIHADLVADSVATKHVKMSQILVAKKIDPRIYVSAQTRSDFDIFPNPTHKFTKGEPVAVYFEIYQLASGNDGKCRYRIEYRVGEDISSASIFVRALMRLGVKKNPGTVTTSYEYSSNKSRVVHYQYLTLSQKSAARQKLTITVTDLVSGKKDSQSISLEIPEKEKQ
ncbi:MAG: GWxTD domain-containing protein [Calditrichaeota bacterium]|nr:GWxTD domain-containing protein [Calditrichota bacterium]